MAKDFPRLSRTVRAAVRAPPPPPEPPPPPGGVELPKFEWDTFALFTVASVALVACVKLRGFRVDGVVRKVDAFPPSKVLRSKLATSPAPIKRGGGGGAAANPVFQKMPVGA